MWRAVTDAVGVGTRDGLWSHPDLLPTADDIDDPAQLVARLRSGPAAPDAVDRALEELLGGEPPEPPDLEDDDTDTSGGAQ